MAYSVDADLTLVAPMASSWAVASVGGDPTTTWEQHRQGAYAEINSKLRKNVAVPYTGDTTVASGLAEVEAKLTAARLVKANLSQFSNIEAGIETASKYEKDAYALLDDMYFPASVSTPASGTAFTGNGTVSVTVSDSWGYRGSFIVQYVDNDVFRISDNRKRNNGPWDYDISEDNQWPSDSDLETYTEEYKALSMTITTGSTAFDKGDYWTFEVYPGYRKNDPKRIGWVPLQRV